MFTLLLFKFLKQSSLILESQNTVKENFCSCFLLLFLILLVIDFLGAISDFFYFFGFIWYRKSVEF